MKKVLFFLVLLTGNWLRAQVPIVGDITAASSDCATANSCVILGLPPNVGSVSVNLRGTWVATLQFEGTNATIFVGVNCSPYPSGAAVSSTTGNGTWLCSVPGLTQFRMRASAYTSGTPTVTIQPSTAMSKSIFNASPTFASMTAGSVLFAGTNGLVSQDNANLFFDDANNRVGIGTATPDSTLHVVGGACIETSDSGCIAASGSLRIGAGTGILKHLSATATLDFANQAAIGCNDLTITVTGAALGDTVSVGVPNGSVPTATSIFSGWVSSSNTVTVRFCALVSGDPASGTFRADVWQH